MQGVPEELLIVYSRSSRLIFQAILWPILIVGLIGNFGVIFRLFFIEAKKNAPLKPLYRSSLLSLAISDILLLLTSGSNVVSSFTGSTILWSLPVWCCSGVPYLQTVAVLVASLTLAGIAIDRYAALKSTFPASKGPEWRWAIAFVAGLWAISFGASYPVLGTYTAEALVVGNDSGYYMGTLCVVANRSEASIVFTALFAVIFIPLAIIFILVHVLLARNIWQRNSPAGNINQQSTNNSTQCSNENSTVSTSLGKPRRTASKKTGPTPSHVARKRRTVRVILVLIIVFALCRLPHWSFLLFKLHLQTSQTYMRYVQIVLTTLSLLNAALHPFLYAFLNEALSLVAWIREKFTDNDVSRITNVRSIAEPSIARIESVKIPRGPYHSP